MNFKDSIYRIRWQIEGSIISFDLRPLLYYSKAYRLWRWPVPKVGLFLLGILYIEDSLHDKAQA